MQERWRGKIACPGPKSFLRGFTGLREYFWEYFSKGQTDMGDHKKNVISIVAAKGAFNGQKASPKPAASAGTIPPGLRLLQLDKAAWLEMVKERSRDMVCKKCGFGFFVPVYTWRIVPADLNPSGVEGPLDVLEYWMCVRCFEAHTLSDFHVLPLRARAPRLDGTPSESRDSTGSEPSACGTGPETSNPAASKADAPNREYLGRQCPVCGIEQFKLGNKITCARGHDATEDPDAGE
jgi:hypothetical protein